MEATKLPRHPDGERSARRVKGSAVYEHTRRTDSIGYRVTATIAVATSAAGLGFGFGGLIEGRPDVLGVAALVGVLFVPVGIYSVFQVVRPKEYRSRLSPDGLVCTVNGRAKHHIARSQMRTFVYKLAPRVEVVEVYLNDGTSERISVWFFDVGRLREQLIALDYPVVWKPRHWTRDYLTTPDTERAKQGRG